MSNPPLTPSSPPAPPTPEPPEKFDIGEEYGTARKSLPPAGIVAICVVVVIAIVAIYSFTNRVKQHSTGSIDDVVAIFPGDVALGIGGVADGIGISGDVEPVAAPMLAIVRRGEQPVDQFLVSVGGAVFHEGAHLGRSGR